MSVRSSYPIECPALSPAMFAQTLVNVVLVWLLAAGIAAL